VFASRKGLPLSNPPGVITPTRDILQEVYMLFRTTSTPTHDSSSGPWIHPAPACLSQPHSSFVFVLLVSRFSNVTFQTLKGHAAVVLMDEHNYRLKKTNSSNRAGSDKETPQPFSTLVCAGSACAQSLSENVVGACAFRAACSHATLCTASSACLI
jgi:hypothetical protein